MSLNTKLQLCMQVVTSSPGLDNIYPMEIIYFIKEYMQPVTYVINMSFESGQFPYLLEIAKIIPI